MQNEVWEARFAASDLLAHVVSHSQTRSPPDHGITHASAHPGFHTHAPRTRTRTRTRSRFHPSNPIPIPPPPPPPRTILPNPRQRYCPHPARLNLPGALHEHVARLCCASQSDRVTPRPSRLELLPAAAPFRLPASSSLTSHPKTRRAARRRLVCLACTTCSLTVLPLPTIAVTSITVQVILLSHSRCGVAFFNSAQPCRSSRSPAQTPTNTHPRPPARRTFVSFATQHPASYALLSH